MRLIDGDKLLAIPHSEWEVEGIYDTIERQPTIDAVPVVRCWECKHRYMYEDWDRSRQESFVCHECRLHQKDFGEDGFCSYGERKDGAEDV